MYEKIYGPVQILKVSWPVYGFFKYNAFVQIDNRTVDSEDQKEPV